jgi:N-acetylglucosamine kinase-like BadF-type ATPase
VPYYLGIDGGGSKTTCAVGDEISVLATATAGPSNIVRVGEQQARQSLHESVRQACAVARITPAHIVRAVIGAAGASSPEIAKAVHRALAEMVPAPIDVVVDTQIALEAAFDTGPGVIVIAGTGSIAYGRNAQGTTARAGGWGFAISDEGSAHWIGRTAIAAVLHAHDRVSENKTSHAAADTSLSCVLMKTWNARLLEDLARTANSVPPPDFAALFPAVLESANGGDELARKVLTQAGSELAQTAGAVIRRLFPSSASQSHSRGAPVETQVRLAMVGGVFRHAARVREVFGKELLKLDTRAQLQPQIVDPVNGALALARRAAKTHQCP